MIHKKFHLHEDPRAPRPSHRKGEVSTIQHRWRVCCQSAGEHRFDCTDTPAEQRGAGPALPVKPMSPRQLVDQVRVGGRP
jgi:hypothetical protein